MYISISATGSFSSKNVERFRKIWNRFIAINHMYIVGLQKITVVSSSSWMSSLHHTKRPLLSSQQKIAQVKKETWEACSALQQESKLCRLVFMTETYHTWKIVGQGRHNMLLSIIWFEEKPLNSGMFLPFLQALWLDWRAWKIFITSAHIST